MEMNEKKANAAAKFLVTFEVLNPSENITQELALGCGGPIDG
jgi:hypothetical protein